MLEPVADRSSTLRAVEVGVRKSNGKVHTLEPAVLLQHGQQGVQGESKRAITEGELRESSEVKEGWVEGNIKQG